MKRTPIESKLNRGSFGDQLSAISIHILYIQRDIMTFSLSKELEEKIIKIKLLILDVDGVLTDGRIIYDSEGRELRFFDAHDGTAIRILFKAGIKTMLATILPSKAIERRAKELLVEKVFQGIVPKTRVLEEILEERDISKDEICYVGDDLVDLGIMKAVGFPAAPANACREVKDVAYYVTQKQGGRGAVREIAELILKTQGKWNQLVEEEFG
jgi:3-deoxy-D-manno-octulosonate 8-phosphate phosphatase (KDO 8-P phosphatase)